MPPSDPDVDSTTSALFFAASSLAAVRQVDDLRFAVLAKYLAVKLAGNCRLSSEAS